MLLFFTQMCVKPRKLNVSGFPSPRLCRLSIANGPNSSSRVFSGCSSRFQIAPVVRYNSSHPFNLLAGTNVNNDRHSTNDRAPRAGRNTGIGPDYVTFDVRLSRRFKLTEKDTAQLIAEGFNVFNRTNFASVNNVVGVIGPPFKLSGTEAASPSQPLGFTSALAKREIQLGVRINF